jgi:DNA-binding response OmpR family regulator
MTLLQVASQKVGNPGQRDYDSLESIRTLRESTGRFMARLLIIGRENGQLTELRDRLERGGFTCSLLSDGGAAAVEMVDYRPDLVIVGMGDWEVSLDLGEFLEDANRNGPVPVVALVSRPELAEINVRLGFADFIVFPGDDFELLLRIRRQLSMAEGSSGETMEHAGLVIDFDRCEVTVDGELVELTFREYELLKFLASHKGRVHTRDSLLNQVWGYDYFGGDRTVDVHVRRLRGKIEKKTRYIDTVRNIGYRFRDK